MDILNTIGLSIMLMGVVCWGILALGRVAELLNYSAAGVKERTGVLGWEASAAFASNALYEREVAQLAKDYALKSLTYSFEDPDAFFHHSKNFALPDRRRAVEDAVD